MVPKNYSQGSSGETDIENRLMDMERGEERVIYGKTNMETYITICIIDSQREFAVWLRKLKQGSVSTQRSRMGREMGGTFKREGIYVYLWLIQVEV